MIKEILCALLEHGYIQCTYSPQEKYSDSKITHWQFRIELVKHMLSNAQQQPQGIVPVPDPVDCLICLVDKHFTEPIPGQEEGRRSTQASLVLYVMSAKRHCQMLVLGTVTDPKCTPLTGDQYVKCALCIDPCFRLYHTGRDYTSEIIKIARHSVKPNQKDFQHVQKDVQHV